MNPATEGKALAERIRQGDPSAENEFVACHSRVVLAMGLARMKDRDAARELVDDVMVAVIDAMRRGTVLDTARLGAFVHGTAINLINNRMRARARRPRLDPIDESSSSVDDAESLERDSEVRLVQRSLRELSLQEQRVLTLSYVEGLKPREIAARLGTTSEAVRQQKMRALRRLKQKLGVLPRKPAGRRPTGA